MKNMLARRGDQYLNSLWVPVPSLLRKTIKPSAAATECTDESRYLERLDAASEYRCRNGLEYNLSVEHHTICRHSTCDSILKNTSNRREIGDLTKIKKKKEQ